MVQQGSQVKRRINELARDTALESVSCEQMDLESRIDTALNQLMLDCLPQTALILSILYLLVAWGQSLYPPSISRPLMVTALSTALFFFSAWGIMAKVRIPPVHAQWIGMIFAGTVLVNTFLHMGLTGDAMPGIFLVFILLGAGYFYLSTLALVSVVVVTVAGWFTIFITSVGQNSAWTYLSLMLVASVGFTFLIHNARRRSIEQLERIRYLDADKAAGIQRRAMQLQTLVSTVKRLHATLDSEDLLQFLVENIQTRFQYAYVGVFLLDESATTLVECAVKGVNAFLEDAKPQRVLMDGRGLISLAAAKRETIYSADVIQDVEYVPMAALQDIQSELVIPLVVGDDLLGVLDIRANKYHNFQSGDIDVFESLAGSLSAAIRNAMLYGVEHSRRLLSEKLYEIGRAVSGTLDLHQVLDLILDSLALIVHYDRASVLLESGNELEIVAARGYPPESNPLNIRVKIKEEDVFRTIYRTQKPLSVPEILDRQDWYQVKTLPQARSWVGLPLINAEEKVIGMLSLTRELPNPYTKDEIALGAAFAGQAAVALQNAQLYNKLSKAYVDLEHLDQAKSDFLTLVSHELRTPLTLLMGYSEMLNDKNDLLLDAETHNLMNGIVHGGKRLHEIVERMIDVAEIDNETLDLLYTSVNVPHLVLQVAEEFKDALKERHIQFYTRGLEGLPPVEADRSLLKKVFYHLLMNSIKYTPDDGRIQIRGKRIEMEVCGAMEPGIEIIVKDNGVGVATEVQHAIFDKFYRVGDVTLHSSGDVKFMGGGPGLGLAIVKGIVIAHHGKVWVESPGFDMEKCPGSTFHILLPLEEPFIDDVAGPAGKTAS